MMGRTTGADLPTPDDLREHFIQKYGALDRTGPTPRRRWRFGYSLPADVYEATVSRLVTAECRWLDVGGGSMIFPENAGLSRTLAARSGHVTAVDPSANVLENSFVHERVQMMLEDFAPSLPYQLATLRMVVEHVSDPQRFVAALARLIAPGGTVVVFTVSRWAPVSLVSRVIPFRFHHGVKALFWGGEEEDTFPVHYRMNTRRTLRHLFEAAGFAETSFARLDDLSVFGKFTILNYAELLAWRAMSAVGAGYPESCLLAVYRRLPASRS